MRVVAYFESAQVLDRAAHDAEATGWRVVGACSPAFNETVLEAAHATRSPVAGIALIGGIVGVIAGVILTVGTVRQWPGLIVGGKPLVSIPPFLIIIFELTILFASIAAASSFLWASARARRAAQEACDRTTTDNRLSLLLERVHDDRDHADDLIRRLDPADWRVVSP